MQKSAGSKMKHFLGMLTNNRLMAICLGALITAIIRHAAACGNKTFSLSRAQSPLVRAVPRRRRCAAAND